MISLHLHNLQDESLWDCQDLSSDNHSFETSSMINTVSFLSRYNSTLCHIHERIDPHLRFSFKLNLFGIPASYV